MLPSEPSTFAMSDLTGKVYNTATRMLGLREHSEAELIAKLKRKFSGLSPHTLEDVTADLKRSGLLSDQRFAEMLIRRRISRGYGPYYIRRELAAKGVKVEVAQQQLDLAETNWLQLAKTLIQRRYESAGEDADTWAKAARFLQRRGFSGDLVIKAAGERPQNNR